MIKNVTVTLIFVFLLSALPVFCADASIAGSFIRAQQGAVTSRWAGFVRSPMSKRLTIINDLEGNAYNLNNIISIRVIPVNAPFNADDEYYSAYEVLEPAYWGSILEDDPVCTWNGLYDAIVPDGQRSFTIKNSMTNYIVSIVFGTWWNTLGSTSCYEPGEDMWYGCGNEFREKIVPFTITNHRSGTMTLRMSDYVPDDNHLYGSEFEDFHCE